MFCKIKLGSILERVCNFLVSESEALAFVLSNLVSEARLEFKKPIQVGE